MFPIKNRKWKDDKQFKSNKFTKNRRSYRMENARDSSVERNRKWIMKNKEEFGLPNVDC